MEYTNFRPDLIEASNTNSTNAIKKWMFKLDKYESFSKSRLNSFTDILKCIVSILRYRYVRSKKTSSVILHLQQKGKLLDKILDDKLDSSLLDLKRVYLSDLEENITESDFKPTTEFQKNRKVESETTNLANQCDEIHEAFKHYYLFSNSFSRVKILASARFMCTTDTSMLPTSTL